MSRSEKKKATRRRCRRESTTDARARALLTLTATVTRDHDVEVIQDPFVQLTRSHRRLEERLEDLRWAARGARGAAVDVDAVRDVASFFSRAVRRHEEDEELSLFPRLQNNSTLAPLLARLALEHREHLTLQCQLDKLIETLHKTPDDETAIEELAALSEALILAYRKHLDAEEGVLFPGARAVLDAEALDAMATEMSERRSGGGGGGGGGGGRSTATPSSS